MVWDSAARKYMHLSKELCAKQISEASSIKKLLKSLIQEKAPEEESWEDGVVPLLCECFSTTHQYGELLLEILTQAPQDNARPEYLKVDSQKAEALKAHVSLMHLTEYELYHKHRISLTIH